MSFRTKILIVAVAILLIVGGLVGFFVWRSSKNKVGPATSGQLPATSGQPSADSRTPSAGSGPQPISPQELSAAAREAAIKNQARNFVERFGSYSAEANFSNFAELKPMVTAGVARWLDDYPNTLKAKQPLGFIGVSTFVVSQKITKSDVGSAEVLASTQRQESNQSGSSRYYKDILVKLILVDGVWLIDGAYWQ